MLQAMDAVKILVVDDELGIQRLIEQRFRKRIRAKELEFIFAANGVEALEKLQGDNHVDMVLTDLNMPEMDGLALLGCLPTISENLKAVVISAYTDIANIRQAMNRGAFDFLSKPIDFQDLERTIEKTVEFVHHLKHKQDQTQKIQDELLHAALHDPLTGLPNRAWLSNRLTEIFEQQSRSQEPLYALLFIDLDGFKEINDELGHLLGDELLKYVAQRLKHSLREGDSVARLGGDEFVVFLEGGDIDSATIVAKRIQASLQRPFKLGDRQVSSGASIGIALSSPEDRQPDDLLHNADVAMYVAKSEGKGCYVVFDQSVPGKIETIV